ncbi:MAG: gliding motility-associated C-terminal domain-containing protein [Bacteroidetes bacterium]|nr:gliding motility-associated C-terminal domain-containing protein [Bacteroidota bacterium]MBS1931232.1 gliding motility-associated C-terminal domain-containing protein [Bacteroidota bacterium]
MRIKNPLLNYLILLITTFIGYSSYAQIPPRQWAHHYGGSNVDIPYVIKFTNDSGTIVGGYTSSKDGDVRPLPNRDYWDLWVLKLDKCGNIQWEKSFGGTGYESARDVAQTSDGGYIVLGETNSTDGGVVAGYGGTKDIWLLKLDANGILQWQKRYGGSGLDIGNHIEIMSDGSYLIAASSSSNDGDIKGNHGSGGYTDGVLMKINSTGTLLWSKCYGGSKNEELFDFEIINGNIYLAGFTNSVDGDIPPDQKNYDVWLLALDQNGNKIFSKIYGGSQNDVAYCMTKGADGTLTLAGYTTSNDGDVSGAKGAQDYWVLNVDTKGKLNWQKVLGGTDADYAKTIITDKDGGYIVGGVTYSVDGDISNPLGEADYWTVKLSPAGNVIWKQNWGGAENDNMRYMIHNPVNDEYYLAGDSESGDGDFSDTKGETDFGIIKLKLPAIQTKDSAVCNVNGFIAAPDTLRDVCGNDSVYVTYKPVLINGPFNNIRKADTIFSGQSVTLHANGNGNVFWSSNSTLSCTACTDPVASPMATTVYTATNYLADGCQVSDQFTVVVLNDAMVMMPTAFTPNGDGLNDFFGPIGKVPDGYRFMLYNRNGELVFKSNSIGDRWNGTYKGQLQPTSVFIYLIEYKDLQNKPHQQKGTFLLIR